MVKAKKGAGLCEPVLLQSIKADWLNLRGQQCSHAYGECSRTFSFFVMSLDALFLGGAPGQVRPRQPRSSLTLSKAGWYLSSIEREGGEAVVWTVGASEREAFG